MFFPAFPFFRSALTSSAVTFVPPMSLLLWAVPVLPLLTYSSQNPRPFHLSLRFKICDSDTQSYQLPPCKTRTRRLRILYICCYLKKNSAFLEKYYGKSLSEMEQQRDLFLLMSIRKRIFVFVLFIRLSAQSSDFENARVLGELNDKKPWSTNFL